MSNNINISGGNFPLAKININKGESVFIQTGAMVFKSNNLELRTRLNAKGSNGLVRFIKAVGRSMTSGENVFITEVYAHDNGEIALAPSIPGQISILELDEENQYRINDGAFLAMDGSANYVMKSQSYDADLRSVLINNESITIDNGHVVAWDKNLSYNIHFENNWIQSIGTGEGLVNTFSGTGDIYIQTLNLSQFASEISPLIIHPEK